MTTPCPGKVPAGSSPQLQHHHIGLILSPDSPASTLDLIANTEQVIMDAHFRLDVITIQADPIAAHKTIAQAMRQCSGLLCCPCIYPIVLMIVNDLSPAFPSDSWKKRTLVLRENAAKALVAIISGNVNYD
jgi:hypothetical protein